MGRVNTIRAAMLINRAIDDVAQGDPQSALALIDRALRLIPTARTPFDRVHSGRAHQTAGEAYLGLEQADLAIQAYNNAEQHFAHDRRYASLRVECLHNAAITFGNMGLTDTARVYVDKGLAICDQVPDRYRRDLILLQLELDDCDTDSYAQLIARLRRAREEAIDPETQRIVDHRIAKALFEFGTSADVELGFGLVAQGYEQATGLADAITLLTPICYLQREVRAIPDDIARMVTEVVARLSEDVEPQLQAEAHLTHAVVLWSQNRLDQAMTAALRAVALLTAGVWRVGSSTVRMTTSGGLDSARHVALRLACELNDGALAAELIENARLAGLPEVATERDSVTFVNSAGSAPSVRRPLTPLHPIRVCGQARLAQHYPSSLPLSPPIDLDDLIVAVGGADAWWWGSWLGERGRFFWAVRDPAGNYSCGRADDPEGGGGHLVIDALKIVPSMGTSISVRIGAFSTDPEAEEALSAKLGAHVIPPPLRSAAADVIRRGAEPPMSLTIAGNAISMLPLTLLGVCTSPDGSPVRLVEVAVIRVMAPAALLAHMGPSPEPALPYPVSLSCQDPTDDLKHAHLPDRGGLVLTSPARAAALSDVGVASRAEVIAALRSVPTPRSIFAYSGHADEGQVGADLESHLSFADAPLTAEDIFVGEADGGPIPFPERALLAACGSAGSDGAGTGEWLGVTAAALHAGAREVVATCWPIWDTPITAAVDAAVLDALRLADDIADALRLIQLLCLQEWRASNAAACRAGDAPFPLVWAAYHYFGRPPRL